MGKDFLLNMLLKPLLLRLGTVAAGALVFGGGWLCEHWNACGLVTEGGAKLVVAYVVGVVLVCAELVIEIIDRQWLRRSAASDTLKAVAAAKARRDLP